MEAIVVSDYDPDWPARFDMIRAFVWPAVAEVALRTEHVGSTAVRGLAAKPVIDVDIVAASSADIRSIATCLASLGYRWEGNLGVEGREAFAPPVGVDLPAHHLYAVVEGDRAYDDHWLLRDLLRDDPDARTRYADLKRRNAELARGDLDYYVAAKASFVAELLARARAERGLPEVSYWQPVLPSQPGAPSS
jgi:GrpB-like predicted nucleotidyltransferase (UPF0157 family)